MVVEEVDLLESSDAIELLGDGSMNLVSGEI
jgi:hypothetical protein